MQHGAQVARRGQIVRDRPFYEVDVVVGEELFVAERNLELAGKAIIELSIIRDIALS